MNTTESLMVLRKVIGYQPSQKLDDLTRAAWAEALEPHDVRDALEAVAKIGRSPREPGKPFWMEPRDIIEEVVRVERQRLFRNRGDDMNESERAIDEQHPAGSPEWRSAMKELTRQMKSRDWQPVQRKEITAKPSGSIVRQLKDIRSGNTPSEPASLTERELALMRRAWEEGHSSKEGENNPYAETGATA